MRALCQLCQSVLSFNWEENWQLLHCSDLFALQHSLLSLLSKHDVRRFSSCHLILHWAIGLKGCSDNQWREFVLSFPDSWGSHYKVIRSFQTLKQQRLKSACQSPVVTLIYRPRRPYMLHKFLNLKSISKHLKTNSLFSSEFEYECDKTSFHKFITDE